jgi:homogentisate solanesyltransferase
LLNDFPFFLISPTAASSLFCQAYQIETFATKIGVSKIAKLASVGLLFNYVHAIATGLVARPGAFRAVPMVGGHAALALLLLARFRELDAESIPSIKKYYKHIWDLFYLEYVLYALI